MEESSFGVTAKTAKMAETAMKNSANETGSIKETTANSLIPEEDLIMKADSKGEEEEGGVVGLEKAKEEDFEKRGVSEEMKEATEDH